MSQSLWVGDTDFFYIVAGVLQGDIFAPFQLIICQDYTLWMSVDLIKQNGFTLKKKKKKKRQEVDNIS